LLAAGVVARLAQRRQRIGVAEGEVHVAHYPFECAFEPNDDRRPQARSPLGEQLAERLVGGGQLPRGAGLLRRGAYRRLGGRQVFRRETKCGNLLGREPAAKKSCPQPRPLADDQVDQGAIVDTIAPPGRVDALPDPRRAVPVADLAYPPGRIVRPGLAVQRHDTDEPRR